MSPVNIHIHNCFLLHTGVLLGAFMGLILVAMAFDLLIFDCTD